MDDPRRHGGGLLASCLGFEQCYVVLVSSLEGAHSTLRGVLHTLDLELLLSGLGLVTRRDRELGQLISMLLHLCLGLRLTCQCRLLRPPASVLFTFRCLDQLILHVLRSKCLRQRIPNALTSPVKLLLT